MFGEFIVYTSLPAIIGALLGKVGAEAGSKSVGPYSAGTAGAALGSLLFLISRLAKHEKENKEHRSEDVRFILSRNEEPIIFKTEKAEKPLKSSLPSETVLNRVIRNI